MIEAKLLFIRIFYAVLLMVFFAIDAHAGIHEVSHVMVTDVTPLSYSVIWESSEASTSNLNVFLDEDGAIPATDITTISQPVQNGDMGIATAAEDNGVMKVRVSGLEPDTTYYFQTVTTSKSSADVTYYPESASMMRVTTAKEIVRTEVNADLEVPFTNDLIVQECMLPDGVTPALGALVVANVEGGYSPVSNFVGDGVVSPQCYVDLNNLFDASASENKPLYGGEWLVLSRVMGTSGYEMDPYEIPINEQLAEIKPPQVTQRCLCDVDNDGDVDGSDFAVYIADTGRDDCDGDCPADFNGDRIVDSWDLQMVGPDFGKTACAGFPGE
jgi:hypothetical protein